MSDTSEIQNSSTNDNSENENNSENISTEKTDAKFSNQSAGEEVSREKQLAILEALLFAASEPLDIDVLAQTVPGLIEANVEDLVDGLEESYSNRGLTVQRVAGGWRLATRSDYAEYVRTHLRGRIKTKLSKASLETVSIIAYRQPVSRSEIEQMRGVDSSQVLRHLLERELIKVDGRAEAPGRPLLYGTSQLFLEYFGLDSLHGLPMPEEIFGEPEEEQAGQAIPVRKGPFEGSDSGIDDETYRPDYAKPTIVQRGDWAEPEEEEGSNPA